jgi:hypothetical protein
MKITLTPINDVKPYERDPRLNDPAVTVPEPAGLATLGLTAGLLIVRRNRGRGR